MLVHLRLSAAHIVAQTEQDAAAKAPGGACMCSKVVSVWHGLCT